MFDSLRRWRRRHFRGVITTRVPHWDGGELVMFRSGHIEYHGTKGEIIDVERDLFYQSVMPRDWRCMAYGGGAAVPLYNMCRNEAMREVAATMGTVAYVDEAAGFVFYKPKGYQPTGVHEGFDRPQV